MRVCKLYVTMMSSIAGTGKNKVADRLLHMLGWEREYIQLHRDTTVQSLTVDPQITGGAVSWVDTPLVSAVRAILQDFRLRVCVCVVMLLEYAVRCN